MLPPINPELQLNHRERMIKKFLIILTIIISNQAYGQLIVDIDDYVGKNIKEIKKVGHRNRIFKNGWLTEIIFVNDSLPVREKNYYKGDLRSDYHFSYKRTDSTFQTTKVDSFARQDRNYEMEKLYFNEKGLIYKTETFTKRDSEPLVIETDFRRDSLDRLISYCRTVPSEFLNNSGDLITTYRLYYNDKNQVDSIVQTDSENISTIVYYFKYNKRGLTKSKIVDHNNPDVVLGGVRAWKKGKYDKYGYYYKYDRYGNWTKRFSITKHRKYLDSKRKIKYE